MPALSLPVLKMCKDCSEIAVASDGYCLAHTNVSVRQHSYSSCPKPTAKMKTPFGVEMECHAKNYGTLSRIAHNSSDASLRDSDSVRSESGELKIVAAKNLITKRAGCMAQRAMIAGAFVDSACGLHVHMSVEYSSLSDSMYRIYPYVSAIQDTMFAAMPRSRQNSDYCSRLYYSHQLSAHHSWITFSEKYKTIEVRIHPGTVNPWKMMGWLEVTKVLQSALQSVINGEPNATADAMQNRSGTRWLAENANAYRYMNARINAGGSLKKYGFGK